MERTPRKITEIPWATLRNDNRLKSLVFDAIKRSRQMAFSKLRDIAAENHNKQTPREAYASEYLKHEGNTFWL